MGSRILAGGWKVEALLPHATLGFGVAQNREKVSLEVEVFQPNLKPATYTTPRIPRTSTIPR